MPDATLSDANLLAWLRLARLPSVGPVLIKRLLESLGSAQAILEAHPARLGAIEGIGTYRANQIVAAAAATQAAAQTELQKARDEGLTLLTLDDPQYPPALRQIPDPPLLLYVRGALQPADALAIGVVGARRCTLYGREQAGRFGRELAEAGITVISGGARGIDTCAHEGALLTNNAAAGRTLVIQGCGLLNTYPPENKGLYERIVATGRGAILSDFPLDTPPLQQNFPPRNRIIAGMSLGILVIEANLRSGSLITARLAADDYNREVFALPGRVDSPASAGTHHLLKAGTAHLVESAADILDALGEVGAPLRHAASPPPQPSSTARPTRNAPEPLSSPAPASAAKRPPLTPTQQTILAALDGRPASIDTLIDRTALSPALIMAELTLLQLQGSIQRLPPNHFRKSP